MSLNHLCSHSTNPPFKKKGGVRPFLVRIPFMNRAHNTRHLPNQETLLYVPDKAPPFLLPPTENQNRSTARQTADSPTLPIEQSYLRPAQNDDRTVSRAAFLFPSTKVFLLKCPGS